MDRLDVMHLFLRIVERRSLMITAHDMEIPQSTVTTVIRNLETLGRTAVAAHYSRGQVDAECT